jgi:hypothetical protein
LSGGQEVVGSNPASPTNRRYLANSVRKLTGSVMFLNFTLLIDR